MLAPLEFVRAGREMAVQRTADLCAAYADAYGVEPRDQKVDAFRDRLARTVERPGFEVVLACGSAGDVEGFAFGYPLPADDAYWWVGLRPEPVAGFTAESGSRTFVLAEIEVRREYQGGGVGRRLHDLLLEGRREDRATLAVNPGAQAPHEIYRRWGWSPAGQVPGSSGDYFDAYDLLVLELRGQESRE
jgi:GNAT superfamily N-acetyltransferase